MKKKKMPKKRNFVAKAVAELGLRGSTAHKAKNKYTRKQKHKKNNLKLN